MDRSSTESADPPQALPYDRERDACGIGFVADSKGRASHRVIAMALEALANLAHRGATGGDGRTSDGTGLLIQLPRRFFRHHIEGLDKVADSDLAAGGFFLPARNAEARRRARDLVAAEVEEVGLRLHAWRPVPMERKVLGTLARRTCPAIEQAIGVRPPGLDGDDTTGDAFERRLYLCRRRIEKKAQAKGLRLVCTSLSHRTLAYKSMALASALGDFFPDLRDDRLESAMALLHQRFSTNTRPSWRLAQPFRFLAHNGEINTIQGNANWLRAREPQLESELWGEDIAELLPLLDETASDSAMLDQMLELLVSSGRDPLHAMMMLIPEARGPRGSESSSVDDFYDYHAALMEPWDGPAAVVLSDGRVVAAVLDRNGLRPQRYCRTRDGLVVLGSEAGMVALPEKDIVEKGRLGPGQILAIDLVAGRLLRDGDIKEGFARSQPYGRWLAEHLVVPPPLPPVPESLIQDEDDLVRRQKAFGYSKEAMDRIFDPMLESGKPPVGSMGNDAPLAVLSRQPQLLYSYFKQRFAQVTNPPIDPLRERLVFSLETLAGGWGNLLEEVPEAVHLVRFTSPILSSSHYDWLLSLEDPAFQSHTLRAVFPVGEGAPGLRTAVDRLCEEAEQATDRGISLLVLSDRGVDREHAPIPMLLATAAVHHHLVRRQKRLRITLVCDTGEPREDHHLACLLAYGATLVHPYLAYTTVVERGLARGIEPERALSNYAHALEQGLLKILSRLGVCPSISYHGAQLFEALGLDEEVVERYFRGTPSRVGGVGLKVLAGDVLTLHQEAWGDAPKLVDRGFFRFRKGGEHHELQPLVFKSLHKAVREESAEAFEAYSELVDQGNPSRLRDLLAWRRAEEPLPLSKVEPAANIARRFCTAAMSLGALSREAHEVLAIGMNRLGARSNSGEGGEHVARFEPYGEGAGAAAEHLGGFVPEPEDLGNSAIKQIASGRFGVTPYYLSSALEIEIKMAQGSKPGEGGQIPGHKVTPTIATLRRAVPGRSLISPPPHHDIYSIEDLAQLIHDLRRVNGRARIGVKLVSLAGVGTIAAGVAKAGADSIQISGDDGGTGASPLSSIKHAGMPWELGLAETQQVLVRNGLRRGVTLRVDGGLKTGRDVLLAALLGAEEFGFGTAPLVAVGCVMARQCHMDTCPVGIATQRGDLREKFSGTPENVVAFMLFVAEQVRHGLAQMGLATLDEAIGRFDLLEAREDRAPVEGLDLARLLADPDPSGRRPRRGPERRGARPERNASEAPTVDERLLQEGRALLEGGGPLRLEYTVTNRERSLGARLSGAIAAATRGAGLPPESLRVDLLGTAGQSLGVFLSPGMELRLFGDAQDYVGKGMAGGRLVLRPPLESSLVAYDNVIAGNTLLYGATGGELFAAGRVGERFCVRNSGATAVVEGCGDHGCEYMTSGVAVILGPTGRNFGAGMTGGTVYLWDPENRMPGLINPEGVVLGALALNDRESLHRLLSDHAHHTGSERARELLEGWPASVGEFVRLLPGGQEVSGVLAETMDGEPVEHPIAF